MLDYFGRMNEPDSAAFMQGICGDKMEFYLVVCDNIITDIRYYATGCNFTKICGNTTCKLVINRSISESLKISPAVILSNIDNLPEEHLHCTILSSMVFFKAIAGYIFNKNSDFHK